MSQQTYDPADVTVSIADNTITQFAKGTFVTVTRDAELFSDEVGAGGEVVRVRNNDRRGSIKLTLMQDSPSNDVLSALAALDYASGEGVGSAMIKHAGGSTLHHSENAWVRKIPDHELGTEEGTVEWEIRCAALDNFIGHTTPT